MEYPCAGCGKYNDKLMIFSFYENTIYFCKECGISIIKANIFGLILKTEEE